MTAPSRVWLAAVGGVVAGVLVMVGVNALTGTGDGQAVGSTLDPYTDSEGSNDDGEEVDMTQQPSATPVADPEQVSVPGCENPDVVVASADELQQALDSATAGMTIQLADGRYAGQFVAASSGTESAPITLCGSKAAVLDGEGTSKGYALHLDHAEYWVVSGFTIENSQKGLMADGTVGSVIENLTVHEIGDEAIHLRNFSTDNIVRNNEIYDTGNRREKFGEGIYIGSAESNWGDITAGEPDRSDRNLVEGNTIYDTTAESVDIKEGTSDGILRNNSFDGASMTDDGGDSWVDVKGNNWLIEGNVGVNSPMDGFQTHDVADGWGRDNTFASNTATVNGPGFGFSLTPVNGNTVDCSNEVSQAAEGYANVSCG